MDLNIRIPYWATRGGKIILNGEALPAFSSPSSYLTLSRTWKDGDRVEVSLPMGLHIDALADDPTLQAVMYGPLVLAGRLGSENLSKADGLYRLRHQPWRQAGPCSRSSLPARKTR